MSLDPEPTVRLIEQYRRSADLSVQELRWRYFTLGGMYMPGQFVGMLQGSDPTDSARVQLDCGDVE